MHRTGWLSVSSKKLEACGSCSWKWIPPWFWLWGKLQGSCQQGNKMRKEIWRARVEKTFAHKAHTALGKLHPLLGILISRRWSFLAWNHPAQPETCIPLPHPHHPVQTQAWVVLLVWWLWGLDLTRDSSVWSKGKCIHCVLTAWRQGVPIGYQKTEASSGTLRKGGGMGKVSVGWPRTQWASRCIKTTLQEERGMILASTDT